MKGPVVTQLMRDWIGGSVTSEEYFRKIELQSNCKHNWYRAVWSPPDVCLICGAEEDHG